jgi:hypothetical protein
MSAKAANIAKPMRNVATFVASTARSRSNRRSTSGSSTTRSTCSHSPSTAMPATSIAIVFGDVHPHELASVTPSSSSTRLTLSSPAPSQSTFAPGTRGERGTSRITPTTAGSAMIRPLQNSHGTPACSASTPAIGRPMPPPTPKIALKSPIAPATRSRGNVSRMIPKASGKMPPATPETVRPAMTQPMSGASAHMAEPRHSRPSTTGRTRSLP